MLLQQKTRCFTTCFTTFVGVDWILIGKSLSKFWPCMTLRDAWETDAGCRQRKTWRATTWSLPLLTYHFSSFHSLSFPVIYPQHTYKIPIPTSAGAIDDVSVDVALPWPCQVEECHKMMCRSCGTKFCFGCGAILTENYTCCPAQICKNIARTRGWVGRLVDFGGLMGQSDKSDVSLVFLLFRILTCFDSWHDVSVLVRSCAHPPVHF